MPSKARLKSKNILGIAEGGTGATSMGAAAVGAVAQAAGIPTGAIFETSSDATGEWTKYADGRMVVTRKYVVSRIISTAIGGGFYDPTKIPALGMPKTFTRLDHISTVLTCDVAGASTAWIAGMDAATLSQWGSCYLLELFNRTVNQQYTIYYRAEGRWFN